MKMKTKSRLLQAFAAMASMCFAFGFCRLAAASPVKAEGTDIIVQAGELVSVEGASVTAAKENASAATPYTGLAIESNAPYSGEFNATFNGDNYFEFRFPGKTVMGNGGTANWQENADDGAFTFRIADAADPLQYFEVVIGQPFQGTPTNECRTYVKYGDQIRTRNTAGGSILKECRYGNQGITLPGFNSDGYTGTYNNYLGIEWEGDVLKVNAKLDGNYGRDKQYVTIAEFDGNFDGNAEQWNLPKLASFQKNGYTVSFSSAYETGSDIIFTSINGQSLETASVPLSATQTAAYNGKLAQDGKVFAAHGTSGKLQTAYTYTVGQGEYGNETVFVKYGEDEVSVNTDKYGKQTVTVGGMSVEVHVVMGAAETVSVEDGATVTAAKENASAATPYTGLAIESAAPYSGKFNATFKGDNYFEFRFPGETKMGNGGTANWQENADDGAFTFRIADAADPLQYFEVVIGQPFQGTPTNECRTYVKYGDQIRTRNTAGGGILKECRHGNQGITLPGFNSDGYTGTYNNYLGIEWEGDVLKVNAKLDGNYGKDKRYVTIAEFDGNFDGNAEQWNLPKLASFQKNGYTVSFSSAYETGSDIIFTSINGYELSSDCFDIESASADVRYNGEEIESGGVIELARNETLGGFTAINYYNVGNAEFFAEGGIAIDTSTVDTSVAADYTVTFGNQTFTIRVAEGTVTLPQGKALGASVRLDKNGIRFGLALKESEYDSLAGTYGETYDIGFAVTKDGVTKYQSVKNVVWADITIDGENYKFAVFTILGVPEGESATVLSYYGYLEIGREKRQITETLERSLDTAVENAYANAQESGRQDVLEALEAVYGYVAGAEA